MSNYTFRKNAHIAEAEKIIEAAAKSGNLTAAQKSAVDDHIAQATAARDLEKIADEIEQMRSGWGSSGGELSFGGHFLKAGSHRTQQPSVQVAAVPALGAKAPTMPGDGDLNRQSLTDVAVLGQDSRFLYPWLSLRSASGETAIDDFRQTARSVTGTVERGITAATDKAELATTIEHVVAPFKQWAVILSDVPNAVLDSQDAFRALFDGSMRYEVQKAIDAHAIAQILAATPPAGTTGTGLVAQIRNAVSAMRAEGANPTVLALSPDDAAALDLFEDTGGSLVFATRNTGSSSPVWDLRVAEVAELDDPLLLDPSMLGVFPLAGIQIDVDPYTGFKKNLTSIRAETTGLMHVRNANGARRIGVAA